MPKMRYGSLTRHRNVPEVRDVYPVETQPQAAVPAVGPAKSHKNLYIAGAVLGGVVIVALALALFFSTRGVTNATPANPTHGPAVTGAPAPSPTGGPAVTGSPGPAAPPSVPVTGAPAKPAAPKEVLDYLDFVKQVEARRQALLKDTGRAVALAAGQAQTGTALWR